LLKTTLRLAVFCFFLSATNLYSQSNQTVSYVSSSYPIATPAVAGLQLYSVALYVSYPVGLTPGSYISGAQLNTDMQSFIAAYPTPTDPPEAIFSSVLTSLLNKYPQMTGGSVSAEIAKTVQGISVPTGGTISVVISNSSNPLTGLLAKPKSTPVK
jgi:hypothetical protein